MNAPLFSALLVSSGASILCCAIEGRRYGFSKAEWLKFAHLILPSWVFSVLLSAGEVRSVLSLILLWGVAFFVLLCDRSGHACATRTLAAVFLTPVVLFFLYM